MKKFLFLAINFIALSTFAQYTMSTSSVTTCSGTFSDSGGPGVGASAEYGDDEYFVYTICPDTPGAMVELDFTMFDVEGGWDFLCIYSGVGTGGTPLGCYDNDVPLSGIVSSVDPTGCLTFEFDSDGSVTYDGWEATISCSLPCQDVIADPTFSLGSDPMQIC